MTDPDLEALKAFYTRVITEGNPGAQVYSFGATDAADIETFFEDERKKYYLEELQSAKQEEARVGIYLNGGFGGDQWPEDFEDLDE